MLPTLTLPGYDITEVIHPGVNTIVYRGVSQLQREPVILKVIRAEYPSLEQIARLKHEYRITENLDLEGVVKFLRLESYQNRLVLVSQDFGGMSLKKFLNGESQPIDTFLEIAIQLAKALVSLHTHHIIHKDVKANNIIINPETKECKLTDFSIASCLLQETPQLPSANQLEGTLAYMSPEQTGRMNRTVDYRSDFYSLGVTFYEMLTGRLPFESDDPLELIHCHIAKFPTSIPKLNPEVPSVIAAIVSKLMAKNAEERYQSAAGLLADLETSLKEWKTTGKISEFLPGEQDRAAQLNIPQKLYGRECEVSTLLAAFERVTGNHVETKHDKSLQSTLDATPVQSNHATSVTSPIQNPKSKIEMILVSGYSGIGKSSLVNEIHKPIVRQRGYFISGKFDQLGRSVPYASIVEAFKSLMQQLLTENAQQLQIWKKKITSALGANGQIVIDVIPQLEYIIGKQPQVTQLGATESLNRFNRVFQAFIQVFTQPEHPLVLFLDDLQWADSASLKLIQLLMTNPDSQYLLFIGAYRDLEVNPTHPLIQTLHEIEQAGTIINNIVLRPLAPSHVQQIVVDTLGGTENLKLTADARGCTWTSICVHPHASTIQINTLSKLLYHKTQGNPFFLTQLLKTLHQEKLLRFDFTSTSWQWNVQDILATGITDKSIVELLVGNIQKLPLNTQTLLKLAACIGARFSLNVLATISEQSLLNTTEVLQPALQQGLVLPLNGEYKVPLLFADEELNSLGFNDSSVTYRFLHDRVQQAAYSLIPEEEKKVTHLKIGELLLRKTQREELESNIIFDIVNQLNVGIDKLTEPSEKDELARLNLIAGRRAKAAAAYEGTFKYLNIGIELLPGDSWHHQYNLTLTFYELATEAAYLTGKFEQMEEWADIVLQEAKTILDQVKVYEVKIQTLIAQAKLLEAIKLGLQVLELLDIKLPEAPSDLDIQQALEETATHLQGKNISDIVNLPLMSDAYKLAAIRMLSSMVTPTFVAAPTLYLLTMLLQVKLSIQYGNAPFSTFAYASYGLILQDTAQDIEASYQFGKLALSLMERLNAVELTAKTCLVVAVSTTHIKEHLLHTLPLFQKAYSGGLENGDLEYASLALLYQSQYSYFIGKELASLEREIATTRGALTQIGQTGVLKYHKNLQQALLNLLGRSEIPYRLVGEVYNEDKMLPLYLEGNDLSGLHFLYAHKLILCYLFGELDSAVDNANLAQKYLDGVIGLLHVPIFHFYDSLARLGIYFDSESTQQREILTTVQGNLEKLYHWAYYAPMNFQHKYDLVEAERCQALGQYYQAMDYYDKAIAGAGQNGYIQEEALANERAALFYLRLGKHKIAKTYMTDAYYSYIKWGAIAKVRDLEKHLPNLIIRSIAPTEVIEDKHRTIVSTVSKVTGSTSTASQILDLATVIKASSAITSEINLENLPLKLLHIIVENAGAQKGCLLLDKNNEFVVEAIDKIENNDIINQQGIPVAECEEIPQKVINYVTKTQEILVIRDAILDPLSEKDPYIQQNQCKSILCVPIIYQGTFIGIFYLENNLISGAFTPARLELIKILASQAAIAIKNARLYAAEQYKSQMLQQAQEQLLQQAQDLEAALKKLQQTQSQLVHTEKISSLGQLVAGIAHEVNNPVNFINGNLTHTHHFINDLINHLQLYQQYYPNPVPQIVESAETIDLNYLIKDLPKMIDSMKLGTTRIKDIMQSLRNFSRADGDDKRAANIHEGIDSTLLILGHRLNVKPERPAIQIIKDYGNLPLVECYPGALNQVFMNLLANAIDSIEESNQGKSYHEINNQITIRTTTEGDWVRISISDNGSGMNEVVKQKLFNAFFTTKPEGKGTGLGLSISHRIITEHHGGTLDCISSPGEGATFVIRIPLT
jgi:predicted ATPase/signal transduction histidine kinase/tRNA A-37 threonylcarbamoyl transferase component Bud32